MCKKKLKKVLIITCLLVILIPISSMGHGGRTDSNGGHKDNKNASGLGPYHYHCGNHPAHLHEGGVCPYSSTPVTPQVTTQTAPQATSQESQAQKSTQSYNAESNAQVQAEPKQPVIINAESIKIDGENTEILIGDTRTLTATILPANTSDKSIIWESDNKNIADIDANGNIITYGIGVAKITAKTSNGKESSILLTVKPIEVTEIKLDKDNVELMIGDKTTILATVYPENATNKTLNWSVENQEIATIENGEIIAKSKGITKIICTSKEGIKTEVNLTVNEPDLVVEENTNKVADTDTTNVEKVAVKQRTENSTLNNISMLIFLIELVLLIVLGIKLRNKGEKINFKILIGNIVAWIFVVLSTTFVFGATSAISLILLAMEPFTIAPPICKLINSKIDGKYTVAKRIILYIVIFIIAMTVQ